MQHLSSEWLTEGSLDFEAKKYRLLAYIQEIKKSFLRNALYPWLPELHSFYDQICRYETAVDQLKRDFPKRIAATDLQNFRLIYKRIVQDDACSRLLSELVQYAGPRLQETLKEGEQLQAQLVKELQLELLGLMPLYRKEGYLIIEKEGELYQHFYRFYYSDISLTHTSESRLQLKFLWEKKNAWHTTAAQLKSELVRNFPALPNPPVFRCFMRINCPLEETTLPLARLCLERELAAA